MKTLTHSGYLLSIGAATALLAACTGSSIPVGARDANASPNTKGVRTFKYTGTKQSFTVPAGVTQIAVVARGAAGEVGQYATRVPPARGGRVAATIAVQPGEKLYVFVGGRGEDNTGGFNGGGNAGHGAGTDRPDAEGFGGGGGASDVRADGDTLQDRIIVAAGGGGQGGALAYQYGWGGAGGGLSGISGGPHSTQCSNAGQGGGGGEQHKGGLGGSGGQGASSGANGQPGTKGTLGSGGNGGDAGSLTSTSYQYDASGGGGGGGYYGGGGGGGGAGDLAQGCGSFYTGFGGGGGGGSSYIERGATNVHIWSGYKSARGDGLVIFRW